MKKVDCHIFNVNVFRAPGMRGNEDGKSHVPYRPFYLLLPPHPLTPHTHILTPSHTHLG